MDQQFSTSSSLHSGIYTKDFEHSAGYSPAGAIVSTWILYPSDKDRTLSLTNRRPSEPFLLVQYSTRHHAEQNITFGSTGAHSSITSRAGSHSTQHTYTSLVLASSSHSYLPSSVHGIASSASLPYVTSSSSSVAESSLGSTYFPSFPSSRCRSFADWHLSTISSKSDFV